MNSAPVTFLAFTLCAFGLRKRRRLRALTLVAIGFVGLAAISGCGSASQGHSYVVTVTAAASGSPNSTINSARVSTNFTMNVQ